MVFEKSARFCACFWVETLTGQKWYTLFCAQVQHSKKQKTLKPLSFCSNLACLLSNKSQILYRKQKSKTLIVHIGVFGVLMLFLLQEFTGDVKNYFATVFYFIFCSCFLNPFFLMLTFGLVGFIFAFFFTSSCSCLINQVAMFWFLFLLFWVSWVL